MKKSGFTLAEVLITLSIVGVVAALTAPALVMSSRNQANAARLSVVVSNLENAFTNAIAQEGASNIYGTRMWAAVKGVESAGEGPNANASTLGVNSTEAQLARFTGELGRYMNLNGFKKVRSNAYYTNGGPYVMTSTGGSGEETTLGDTFPIELKNGAVMFFRAFSNGSNQNLTEAQIVELGGSMYSNAADVYIDVNGKSAPNAIGRDLFTFYISERGILYPGGGVDVSVYDGDNRDSVWDNPAGGWACLPEQGVVANSGWGCTARVIAEGYQMNY